MLKHGCIGALNRMLTLSSQDLLSARENSDPWAKMRKRAGYLEQRRQDVSFINKRKWQPQLDQCT